ncbi:DUF2950 domain-containing protein [Eleftheria terrae]|uniref:DUF2950 domain-containing protein n=1 Tax=Eleftheria terrae TaxID=1597781 RepID=UPI00263B3842|nr:DUF2950 domain-containing protein [Eleftheria terrae]WKB55535.1 DUF2950 domain-containing protein [Eleftheria terrae]
MTGLWLAGPASAFAQAAYPDAETAARALVDAVQRQDRQALRHVLGPDWERFMAPGGADPRDIDAFLDAWRQRHAVEEVKRGLAYLSVGEAGWRLPIPMRHADAGWRFDLQQGEDELRSRRIGRNELSAMQAARAYVDAQREYALQDRDGNGLREYASRLVSRPGQRDGLYWPETPGEDPSPLGPLFAAAQPGGSGGYHGYHYRILTAQGPHAPGGAYDYRIGGRMRSGFALLAWPVRYGHTGIMSFMVNHDGRVFEKDLGVRTDESARSIQRFNPDAGWRESPMR